ncbi:hypothetical protein ACWDOP_38720 [Nocardia sp. NPDC003693]
MTTISYVRNCAPSTMVSFGSHVSTQNSTFVDAVTQMGKDIDTALGGWRGEAAAAASARAVSEKLEATKIDEVTTAIAGCYKTYGSELDGTRTSLLQVVDVDVPAAGMTVDSDGKVTPPVMHGAQSNLASQILQAQLVQQAQDFQDKISGLLKNFSTSEGNAAAAIRFHIASLNLLAQNPTTPVAIETFNIDGVEYTVGGPKKPHLNKDETFTPGSEDATLEDYKNLAIWKAKLLAGEVGKSELDDATAAYRRYLENSGEKLEIDFEEAYREDPAIKSVVDSEISRAAQAADLIAKQGNSEFQITGGSYDVRNPSTENWQKTIGAHQEWSHSNVRVDGNKVTMEITVEAMDYYNFNKGANDIATGIPDDDNGRFAEVGLASPFETEGKITRTVTWELGQPPGSSVVTDGSEPQRNPGREDRIDNQDANGSRFPADNNSDTGGARPK